MDVKDTFKILFHPYYGMNILFGISYVCAKLIAPICYFIFPTGTEAELTMVRL